MTVSQDRLLYELLVCTYGFLYTKLVKLSTPIKKNWSNDLETFFVAIIWYSFFFHVPRLPNSRVQGVGSSLEISPSIQEITQYNSNVIIGAQYH